MDSGSSVKFAILIFVFLACPLVSPPPRVLSADSHGEVVIEGEDKQSSQSSIDFGDTRDNRPDYKNLGTKDSPRPSGAPAFREPELDRDTESIRHGKLKRSKVTAVDEFGTRELLLIGTGILAVLLTL